MSEQDPPDGFWRGPWYLVRTNRFEAGFLPSPGEDPEIMAKAYVDVMLPDGSHWSQTISTLAEIESLMRRSAETGEPLNDHHLSFRDGLIVRDAGVKSMTNLLADLLETGEFTERLRRVEAD
jgi:hypothetical protein